MTDDIQINKERLAIARDLSSKGFKSSVNRVKEIEEFNNITGKKHSLLDIANAYKGDDYKDQPKIREKLKMLGDSLKKEQLERTMDIEKDI